MDSMVGLPVDNPSKMHLEEIEINAENYPRETYVTKLIRNPIYQIPSEIMPHLKTYQIEVNESSEEPFEMSDRFSGDVLGFAGMSIDQFPIDSTGRSDDRMCRRAHHQNHSRRGEKSELRSDIESDRQVSAGRGKTKRQRNERC